MQSLRVVSQLHQDVPQHQAVLSAGDADQHQVGRGEQPELPYPLLTLPEEEHAEAFGAEGRIVAREVDRRFGLPASLAFHRKLPPRNHGEYLDGLPVLYPMVPGEQFLPLRHDHRGRADPRIGQDVRHAPGARDFQFRFLLRHADAYHAQGLYTETVVSPGGRG